MSILSIGERASLHIALLLTAMLLVSTLLEPTVGAVSSGCISGLSKVSSNELVEERTYFLAVERPEEVKVEDYDLLLLPDGGFMSEIGKPALPTRPVLILLPPGRELADVSVQPLESVVLNGHYYIAPAQPPTFGGKVETVDPDPDVYSSHEPYPGKLYELNPQVQTWRGYRFVVLTLYPVQYVPAEGRVTVYTSFKVKVKFKASTGPKTEVRPLPTLAYSLSRYLLNPEILSKYGVEPVGSLSPEMGYLIITRNMFLDAIQPLVSLKEDQGFTVYNITVEDIVETYDGVDVPEKIRNCIIDYYQNYDVTYVLLVGDADPDDLATNYALDKSWEIPTRYVYNPDPDEGYDEWFTGLPNDLTPTDYYYAGLNGTWDADGDYVFGESPYYCDLYIDEADWFPEVFVGRLPVRTADELSAIVNKLVDYYADVVTHPKSFLLMGAHLFDTQESIYTDGAWAKEAISTLIPPEINSEKLYENPPYENLSFEAAIDSINSLDPVLVNTMSHGSPQAIWLYWQDAPFMSIYTPDYVSNRGFLQCAMACLSNAFDSRWTTLSEALIKDSDGSAVGYIGMTRVAWGFEGPSFLLAGRIGTQEWLFWYTFLGPGACQAGPSLYLSETYHYMMFPSDVTYSEAFRKNMYAMMLIGDPSFSPFASKITVPAEYGNYSTGDVIHIEGTGFAPDSTLNIYFRYQKSRVYGDVCPGPAWEYRLVQTTTADKEGSFVTDVIIPLVPTGSVDIIVVDEYGNFAYVGQINISLGFGVSPSSGPVKTVVSVAGYGFSANSSVLILFTNPYNDTAIIDYFLTDENGSFTGYVIIPETMTVYYGETPLHIPVVPGKYTITVVDTTDPTLRADARFTVLDVTPLDVNVETGSVHFRGEIAEFYILTSFKGEPVNATITSALLYYENGTLTIDLTAATELIGSGLFRIPFTIPTDAPAGAYTLVVEACYENETVRSKDVAMATFSISPTLAGWNAILISIEGDVAVLRTDAGEIKVTLDTILSIANETKTTIEGWTGASSTVASLPTLTLTTSRIVEGPTVTDCIIELVLSGPEGSTGTLVQVVQKAILNALGATIDDVVILIDGTPVEFTYTEYDTYYVIKVTYTHSEHSLTIHLTGHLDSDDDGLPNWSEYVRGTNPTDRDTDNDLWSDKIDAWPLSPLMPNALIVAVITLLIAIVVVKIEC